MNAQRIDLALAAVAFVVGGAAVARSWPPAAGPSALRPSLAPAVAMPRAVDAMALHRSALATADADPFRLSRQPSDVPYSRLGNNPPITPPPAPRPSLVLKGIVGGPPWQAVIDGLPGAPPGAVVTVGAEFGKLTVRAVTRDSVVVQGPDTTWILTIKRGAP